LKKIKGAGVSSASTTLAAIRSENIKREQDIAMDNRRRELEIKGDITSKMAEAMAQIDVETSYLFYHTMLEKEEKNAFIQNTKKSYIDLRAMSSKLEVYFPDTDIPKKWLAYYDLLTKFGDASEWYFDRDRVPLKHFELALDDIKHYLSYENSINSMNLTTNFDEDQWWLIWRII
jgi:hypothetical protein